MSYVSALAAWVLCKTSRTAAGGDVGVLCRTHKRTMFWGGPRRPDGGERRDVGSGFLDCLLFVCDWGVDVVVQMGWGGVEYRE